MGPLWYNRPNKLASTYMAPTKVVEGAEGLQVELPFDHVMFKLNDSPFTEDQLSLIDDLSVSERAQFIVFADLRSNREFGDSMIIFFPIPRADEETTVREALDARNVVATIQAANPNLELRDAGFYNAALQDLFGIAPLLRYALEDSISPRTRRWREHLKNTLGVNVFPHHRSYTI